MVQEHSSLRTTVIISLCNFVLSIFGTFTDTKLVEMLLQKKKTRM